MKDINLSAANIKVMSGLLLAPLILTGPEALALTSVRQSATIGPSTPADNYEVGNGAVLTVNGATTNDIRLLAGGGLVMNAGSISNSRAPSAVQVGANASAIIRSSSIHSERQGISLLRAGDVGSSASVYDSNISGASIGALISQNSALTLERSSLKGEADGSVGVRLFTGGILNSVDAQISGAQDGILIVAGTAPDNESLVDLKGTVVNGLGGAAIRVGNDEGAGAKANINVSAGSALTGQNGILLEVRNASSAVMSANASQLRGDIIVEQGSDADISLTNGAELTGQLINVGRLSIGSQSTWALTQNAAVGDLSMGGGHVQFKGTQGFQQLTLNSLTGHGDFLMRTDLASQAGDFLDVTGNASGSYVLHVANTGGEPTLTDKVLGLVRTGGGDAEFTLYGGKVDAGAWQYSLVRNGNDWGLGQAAKPVDPVVLPDPEPSTSASTDALLNMASANKFIFFAELDSISNRLVNDNSKQNGGLWINYLHNNQRIQGSWSSAYELQQNGFILGADRHSDIGQHSLITGAFVTRSDGKIQNARGGESRVSSWGGGLYASLSYSEGWYAESTLKFNRFSSDLSASMSDGTGVSGSWNSYGWGASLEGGRHISLSAAPVKITPYVSLDGYQNQDRDVRLSNGMKARTGNGASLRLEAGLRTAYALEVAGKAVTPYLNLAAQQEVVSSSPVNINDKWDFSNDFTGTLARVGGGVNIALNEAASFWAEIAYANGKHVETPINASVGIRYSF